MSSSTKDARSAHAADTVSPTVMTAGAVAGLGVPVMLVLVAVLAAVPGVSWYLGIPLGLAVSALIVVGRTRNRVDKILTAMDPYEVDEESEPRLHNVVAGLSLTGGVEIPTLMVLDDEARNLAVVDDGNDPVIVFSSGILETTDRIGLEALVSAAITRLRNGDAVSATTGFSLFGPLLSGRFGGMAQSVGSWGLEKMLGRDRDLWRDQEAVLLTRYPPGLASAFEVMAQGSIGPAVANSANDHLWLVAPSSASGQPIVGRVHSSLDLRRAVLDEA